MANEVPVLTSASTDGSYDSATIGPAFERVAVAVLFEEDTNHPVNPHFT